MTWIYLKKRLHIWGLSVGENTKIEWATHSWNPWIGCTRVSPGCQHCYAESLAKRTGLVQWGPQADRRVTSDANWRQPLKWARQARETGVRPRVFCASLADVFEDRPELVAIRERLWYLIAATPGLDWLLLTKRPENMTRMVPWTCVSPSVPWGNVWLGTTVEDQQRADERISHLLRTPAAVRFLSCEPLLGPVDLDRCYRDHDGDGLCDHESIGIDWVIAGGESGHGARPMHPDWARSLRDQCQAAGVPFLFKQWGQWLDLSQLRGGPGWARTRITDGKMYGRVSNGGFDGPENMLFGGRELETRYPWDDNTYPCMIRVGKHDAGRLLDNREWSEFPEVCP